MDKKKDKNFEEFYKKFLEQDISKREIKFLRFLPPDSDEGKAYVEFQREMLRYAFNAGAKEAIKELYKHDPWNIRGLTMYRKNYKT